MKSKEDHRLPGLEAGPVLVTGAAGFMGSHLMKELRLGSGDIAADITDDFAVPAGVSKLQWTFPSQAPDALKGVRYIVHLAALSSVSRSLKDVRRTYEINLFGTLSVLDYMVRSCPDARLLFISSAEVYKPSHRLLHEDSAIGPINPYGTSKASCEIALFQYARNYDLDVVVARPFPHFGPGQSDDFVFPSFCKRIISAKREVSDSIIAGNLNPVRDYLYVSDVARAYRILLTEGKTGGVYNICSGSGVSIGDMVQMLIDISGSHTHLEIDPQLLRPADVEFQVGDPSKIRSLQGWEPRITRKEGLTRLYRWWEERT